MSPLLDLAQAAAAAAGEFLSQERPVNLRVETKSSATDAVTEMDRGSEALISAMILAERPDDAILGEEAGQRAGTSGVRWIIDPLDGTVNYLYGLPMWAVSIGVEHQGEIVAGVVHAPQLGVTWWASHGAGAWRSIGEAPAQPVVVAATAEPSRALVATGFGYDPDVRVRQGQRLHSVIGGIRDIRRAGAAAIDLCWVADGSVDAYFEQGTHLWDRAAAGLVVTEAGGVLRDTAGRAPTDAMTIAANAGLAGALAALIKTADEAPLGQ